MYKFESKFDLLRSTLQVKQQVSEAVVRRFFKNFVNSTGKHVFESLGLQFY